MTTMIAELYDALIAAGSPQDKARAAAAAMAEYDPYQQRLVKVEYQIPVIRTYIPPLSLRGAKRRSNLDPGPCCSSRLLRGVYPRAAQSADPWARNDSPFYGF